MLKHISTLRARGATIVGHGVMVKVLLISMTLVAVGLMIVALAT
jgi:hypothetical protein